MELPPLFPDLEPGGRIRLSLPRLKKAEKAKIEARERKTLRAAGTPVAQPKLRIRWRTSSAPIKRRQHEKSGNDEFLDTPAAEFQKLVIAAFEDAVHTLNSPDAPELEVAEIAAWVDAQGTGPTGVLTAAELFALNLHEATGEHVDAEIVVERLRSKIPEITLQKNPKAFAAYLAAYLCG
jgi:hypothetical protein